MLPLLSSATSQPSCPSVTCNISVSLPLRAQRRQQFLFSARRRGLGSGKRPSAARETSGGWRRWGLSPEMADRQAKQGAALSPVPPAERRALGDAARVRRSPLGARPSSTATLKRKEPFPCAGPLSTLPVTGSRSSGALWGRRGACLEPESEIGASKRASASLSFHQKTRSIGGSRHRCPSHVL